MAQPSRRHQLPAAVAAVVRYQSLCSGIGSDHVAWGSLGWECAAFAEIDPQASGVLSTRFPDVPNHGDFTTLQGDEYGPIQLAVAGTPCQSFSLAGLRGGLADDRGNLALECLSFIRRARPRWVVWENVPGVLSSTSHTPADIRREDIHLGGGTAEPGDGGRIVHTHRYDAIEAHSFGCFLAGLSECGYGWAYRILDAQHTKFPTCLLYTSDAADE